MTLTALANHVCTQCDLTDTDDNSAALMFLQRRLEMIWNSQLWRDSLLEAVFTVNPDGTNTLADVTWLPASGILLLPSAIGEVIAVRQDVHAMNVASLESYYRTDTDWLDMQGDANEFQVLSPAVMQWAAPTPVYFNNANTADNALPVEVSFSPDGVSKSVVSLAAGGATVSVGNVTVLTGASKNTSTGNFVFDTVNPVGGGFATLLASANTLPVHQRIRFTVIPQAAMNLRVLGKGICPILGAYDTPPIKNVEPCLIAFARADMLLRARQNGKAQIAMQEGGTLLAQLAANESFQQAASFRIQPDGGFGDDNSMWQWPNSLHPL